MYNHLNSLTISCKSEACKKGHLKMGWNEPTQKKEKKMTYIHCDIRDGVDVKKPKSISRIIGGPQKVKKI